MTVADQLRHWEADVLPVSGLAPGTVRTYKVLVRSPLIPTLGTERLSSFNPTASEKWLTRLAAYQTRGKAPEPAKGAPTGNGENAPRKVYRTGKPIGQSTQRLAFAVLHRALETAVRDGLIVTNPLDSVRRPSPGRLRSP